jgi:autotransporter passenger strand-loop-strand repeat protein
MLSSGIQYVEAGGTASSTTVNSGLQIVSSGGMNAPLAVPPDRASSSTISEPRAAGLVNPDDKNLDSVVLSQIANVRWRLGFHHEDGLYPKIGRRALALRLKDGPVFDALINAAP